jgi:hypothetical protein
MNMKFFLIFSVLFILVSCSKESSSGPASNGLSDGLPANQQRIFITSTTFNGNLGGLSGADTKCQAAATAAGLSRTYKAFLSSSTTLAKDKFNLDEPIFEVDSNGASTLVAHSLTDFNIGNVISDPAFRYNETGADQNVIISGAAIFWIATGGGAVNFCSNWTSSSSMVSGDIGCTNSGEVLSGWTLPILCDQIVSLICISDS